MTFIKSLNGRSQRTTLTLVFVSKVPVFYGRCIGRPHRIKPQKKWSHILQGPIILLGDRLSYMCLTSIALFDVIAEAERHYVDQSGLIKIVLAAVLLPLPLHRQQIPDSILAC